MELVLKDELARSPTSLGVVRCQAVVCVYVGAHFLSFMYSVTAFQ